MIGALFESVLPHRLSVSELSDLNSTNYKVVETMKLFKLTVYIALTMFAVEIMRDHDDSASNILDTTMLALFGFAGVNAAQYTAKRFSNTGYAAAKASGAPSQVVQTTGTVVAQNPGGPVDTSPAPAPVVATATKSPSQWTSPEAEFLAGRDDPRYADRFSDDVDPPSRRHDDPNPRRDR